MRTTAQKMPNAQIMNRSVRTTSSSSSVRVYQAMLEMESHAMVSCKAKSDIFWTFKGLKDRRASQPNMWRQRLAGPKVTGGISAKSATTKMMVSWLLLWYYTQTRFKPWYHHFHDCGLAEMWPPVTFVLATKKAPLSHVQIRPWFFSFKSFLASHPERRLSSKTFLVFK